MTPPRPEIEALLDNAAWARALAKSLVRDPHHADDLVQRTFVAALEHPPRDKDAPRGWITSVLRNFVRQDARAADRREHHERTGARPEATDPDSVERTAALQRELLDAVMTLGEPYKSTIWARYYDGLAPREIAHRDGIPVKTVKTRLVRGLAELRLRLDTNHDGNRSTWLAAFAPLCVAPKSTSLFLGAIMMDVKVKIAAAVVVAAGTVAVLARITSTPPVEPNPLSRAPVVAPELDRTPDPVKLASESLAPARAAVEAPKETNKPAPATTEVAKEWSGHVLDLALHPMRGLEVYVRENAHDLGTDEPTLTTSGDDGSFRVPVRTGHAELAARGGGWVTVFAASNGWEQADDEFNVFVAQDRPLAGRVVDAQHRPIAGANVGFIVDASVRRDIGKQLDTAMPTEWRVVCDADGRFTLDHAPLTKGQLAVEAIGHKSRDVEAPSAATWDMEIVLDPLEVEHLIVRGTVVDEHARPVAGAMVALGPQSQKTSDDGSFVFDMDDVHDGGESVQDSEGGWVARFRPDALFAVKPGKLPARVELPPIQQMRSHDAANTFTLVISGEPLEIRGRVLDADGTPVSGAIVRLEDETPFGMVYDKVQGEGIGMSTTAEALLRGHGNFTNTYTDKDGSFKLGGLLDREYHVIACDKGTLRRTASEAIHAGKSDALIRFVPCKDCVRVAGRVIALDGTPIRGASVGLNSVLEGERTSTDGPKMETDAEGRFDFASVATNGLRFSVTQADIFFLFSWKPGEKAVLDALEIRVSRKAHVQVDLGTDKTKADQFGLVDAHGDPVDMMMSRGNMMWMPQFVEIVDGKSEAVACAENGAVIVLYKDKAEVARWPVHLVPGEVTTVRP